MVFHPPPDQITIQADIKLLKASLEKLDAAERQARLVKILTSMPAWVQTLSSPDYKGSVEVSDMMAVQMVVNQVQQLAQQVKELDPNSLKTILSKVEV